MNDQLAGCNSYLVLLVTFVFWLFSGIDLSLYLSLLDLFSANHIKDIALRMWEASNPSLLHDR